MLHSSRFFVEHGTPNLPYVLIRQFLNLYVRVVFSEVSFGPEFGKQIPDVCHRNVRRRRVLLNVFEPAQKFILAQQRLDLRVQSLEYVGL